MDALPSTDRQALLRLLRSKRSCTGDEIIAASLRRLGITHVYGVGGVPIDGALAACAKTGLRVIGARHQQGAVLMSLAHNYVSGCLRSAVIVSAGPAVANCATGILYGQQNRWPLLVLGGRRALSIRGGFQELDGERLLAPIAKWTSLVAKAGDLSAILEQAAWTASSGPPGPVYIDVAEEAISGRAEYSEQGLAQPLSPPSNVTGIAGHAADPSSVGEAVSLLAQARRPAMLLGKGARWSQPTRALRRLADEFEVPFAASPMGRGLLADDHPLCFSAIRGRMLTEADLVLVVGTRLDWTFRHGTEISPQARIVHIDSDPIEAADVLARGVSLQGNATAVLQQLLAGLDAERAAGRYLQSDREWLDGLRARIEELDIGVAPPKELGLLPMSPFEWLAELRIVLPEDAITVLDGNIVMTAAQRMLPVRRPASRLTPGTNGCMGIGIPFAIGAKLARPEIPVVAIVGDFAFGLSTIELETAVRHQVPVVVVVANNAGPGGATRQRSFFADHLARVLQFGTAIRHDLTMASFGGRGVRVERPGELGAAAANAIASGVPVCIDVMTNEETALSAAV